MAAALLQGNRIPRGLKATADPAKRILLDQMPKILRGYAKTPNIDAVVVVLDSDRKDCTAFLAELKALADECEMSSKTMFRLAIGDLLRIEATPHQGTTNQFLRLIQLLDRDAFPDEGSITRARMRPFVIRTEKRGAINAEGQPLFKPRMTRLQAVTWPLAGEDRARSTGPVARKRAPTSKRPWNIACVRSWRRSSRSSPRSSALTKPRT